MRKSSLPLKLGIFLHFVCPSSLNSKTHSQKIQIWILWIIQRGGIATNSMVTKFQLLTS